MNKFLTSSLLFALTTLSHADTVHLAFAELTREYVGDDLTVIPVCVPESACAQIVTLQDASGSTIASVGWYLASQQDELIVRDSGGQIVVDVRGENNGIQFDGSLLFVVSDAIFANGFEQE